jgi:septal ring factor EnvC (AmiA/AmiB activator)
VLEKKVKTLSRECASLKESLDRATTNESAISEKYKTSQREIKSSRDLYNECTRVLEAYEKMWKDCSVVSFNNGIQAVVDEAAPIAAFDTTGNNAMITIIGVQTHPLSFAQYFTYLVSQYTSLSHSFSHARSQLSDSSKLASYRGEQVTTLSESLRVKVDSETKTKAEMVGWRERAGVLEARVAGVEEEKRIVENKMKRVITGFKVIVGDE